MDQTALFRACVKAVRVRHKNLEIKPRPPHESLLEKSFTKRAKTCVTFITQLRDYLINNRKEYIDSCCHVGSIRSASSIDPDKIDADAEKAIKNCHQLLKDLQTIAIADRHKQAQDHENAVVAIVEVYLKAVCGIYAEQRAIRTKRSAAIRRYSRLSSLLAAANAGRNSSDVTALAHAPDTQRNRDKHREEDEPTGGSSSVRRRINVTGKTTGESTKRGGLTTSEYAEMDRREGETALGEHEEDQFLLENEQLYKRVNTMVDDLQQLEGKVVEIARLQQMFTEKVLEQDVAILNINQTAVHTTENIKDANEFIRQAMKRQSSMRVYLIFSLLVLTFTLWFLDWYNP